jgi:hypothetical protein
MLKKPCSYHKTPVNHTLEQCDMLKKYYSRVAAKEGEAKKDGGDGDAGGFPVVENVFLIFGGPTVDMSNSQRKREWHEVLAAEKAPPSFLDWSEDHHLQPRGSPEPHPQPGSVPAGGRPSHRERAVLEGADGRRQQPQHPLRAHFAPVGDRVGPAAAQHDIVPWRRAGQARPTPRADQPASLVRHTRQLPQGNAHL